MQLRSIKSLKFSFQNNHPGSSSDQQLASTSKTPQQNIQIYDNRSYFQITYTKLESEKERQRGEIRTISILIEQAEGLLELGDLIVGELVGHCCSSMRENCSFFLLNYAFLKKDEHRAFCILGPKLPFLYMNFKTTNNKPQRGFGKISAKIDSTFFLILMLFEEAQVH